MNTVLKRFSLYSLMILGVLGFTSCGDDEDEDPVASITVDQSSTQDGATVSPGEIITFKYTVTDPNGDMRKRVLKEGGNTVGSANYTVTASSEDKTEADTSNPYDFGRSGKDSYSETVTWSAPGAPADYTFTLEMLDKNDVVVVSEDLNITVAQGGSGGAIETQPGVTLSAPSATPPADADKGFYSIADGSVETFATAKSDPTSIDFAYGYSSSQEGFLGSLDDKAITFNTVWDYDFSTNGTPNTTNFYEVTADFDTVTTAADIESIVTAGTLFEPSGAGASDRKGSRYNTLTGGEIVGFKTSDDVYGLIKVNSAGSTDIDMDIKWQDN